MFALFFSLYMAMFSGTWQLYTINQIANTSRATLNGLGLFVTSIFGDNTMSTLGDVMLPPTLLMDETFMNLVCLILALITSIGIVVMAVKGIKRVFGVFFMGIRR